ncbi:PDZ domain-containing protein [Candidatus Binatus sp.]|uniref:PDZ domain-containing protein n=1 Tax=Candidatus Binatus sp. TaxID=2811406 RepID=UPI003C77C350
MKNAGVLTSKARLSQAFGASLAAMLLVVFAGARASAQSAADTTASETWKTAAASAAASSSTSGTPSNLVPTPLDNIEATAPGTAEIPAANPANTPQQQPQDLAPDSQPSADSDPSNQGNDIARYQQEQSGIPPQQVLQQFDNDGELSTPFGMQLREAKRTLKSGEDADGLLITAVQKGSPAAAAGLHPYTHVVHDALAGAAMVGAMAPFGQAAILLIPVLDIMQIGESYDMIIGVDGSRVTNFLDFQDRMRDLQPGEIIYLSVVRDGKRLQVTLPVTANTLQATN